MVTSDVPEPLPESVVRPRQHVEAVRAQSIAETGANGRAALAWEWALGGNRPSPVTLSLAPGRPPARDEILAEAAAEPEGFTAPPGVPTDFCDQLYEARRVLAWLAGGSDEIPVDADHRGRFIGARDDFARTDADIRLARARAQHDLAAPGLADTAAPRELAGGRKSNEHRADSAWSQGVNDLLGWVLGGRPAAPLSSRAVGLPTVADLACEEEAADELVVRCHTGGYMRGQADSGYPLEYGEAIQASIRWLRGEVTEPPVDL